MPDAALPVAGSALTARGIATRERILATAAALMHEKGATGTSLDDVLAGSGTSKSQLYHYFADKSSLVRAVVRRQVQQVLQGQQPELDAFDSLAGLVRWRDAVVALSEQQDRLWGCPLGRLAGELAEREPTARVELVEGFAGWQERLAAGLRRMRLREGLDGDPDELAEGLLAALQGGLLLARTTQSVAPLEAALDLALAGIAAHRRCMNDAATPA